MGYLMITAPKDICNRPLTPLLASGDNLQVRLNQVPHFAMGADEIAGASCCILCEILARKEAARKRRHGLLSLSALCQRLVLACRSTSAPDACSPFQSCRMATWRVAAIVKRLLLRLSERVAS